jgi:RHS repeat-associated protein
VTHPGSVITRYGYDRHGNLKSVMDAENHETTYTHDDMGRVVSTTSVDIGTSGYVYDAAGNLAQKTDATGITVRNTYDALKRLTEVQFPDASQNITYVYDTGSFGLGRLSGITDPAGSAEFGYDSRGRLIVKVRTIAGQTNSIRRGFTPGGRLNSFTYPSGRTIDYIRHGSGRIMQATTTQNLTTLTLVDNLFYNPFGSARGLETGSGGRVGNRFDENGDLKVINSGRPMQQLYRYDGNRNLLSILASNHTRYNRQYSYDPLNRLLSANTVFGKSDYTYDDVGNRLSRTINGRVDTYTYQPGTNRLAQVTGANPEAFSYDDNGNITDIDSMEFVYNQNNRLIRVEDGSVILAEYTYNGFGQRLIKQVDGIETIFHYDFDGNIIAESEADGSMTAEYLYVDQSRMAVVDSSTGKLYFYHNNYLGTPIMMTDDTGTVVWEGDYRPFGEASVNPKSSVVNNFRFSGQYSDEETGLHYNYHRYYDPTTGRYLTPDPIGLEGGINLFVYSENNPINLVDPWGLFKASPFGDPIGYNTDYGGPGGFDLSTLPQPGRKRIPFPSFGRVDPRTLKPGADSMTGPMAFYGAGSSLIITGAAVTKSGVGIMAGGGPVGWVGGGIVTIVGGTIWLSGVGTIYQGYQVDVQRNTEVELSHSDSFWGIGTDCVDD